MHTGTHLFESRKIEDISLLQKRAGIKSVFAGGSPNYKIFSDADFLYYGDDLTDEQVIEHSLQHFNKDGARLIRLHLQHIRDAWKGPKDPTDLTSAYIRMFESIDIRQRVYRGDVDLPKTTQSIRRAALPDGLIEGLAEWRKLCVDTRPEALVFPSERGTPLSRDNFLRRSIQPKLKKIGLAWVNFQAMRRTHSTLMNNMGIEGKLVADQLGHSLDVNQNVYTQTTVERRKVALDQLETALVM